MAHDDSQVLSLEEISRRRQSMTWATVCLVLLISIMLQLRTRSSGFSNAFAQDDMKGEPVYISPLPMMGGFPRDKMLKLNKGLYGQVDAPRMWYDKLRA
eukprot:2681472-Ditylum_brightwellii.AAC.1